MSTVCKLNPFFVRRARRDRREAIQSIHRAIPKIPSVLGRLAAAATAATLEAARRNPTMTGAEKQAHFNRIINQLRKAA